MVGPGLAGRGLAYEYAGVVRAVDGVDLAVAPGELVALLGPNGSGKSTIVKLLAGLLDPLQGDVSLDGAAVTAMSARARARRIAVLPQEVRSLPDVTVAEFVMAGRYGHLGRWRRAAARDREAVARALDEADAAELSERLVTELSGGQRQRALVARALAQEAELWLVDEPTTSLDPEHQVRVFELLARMVGEGRGAIVVTHELNLASQFSTRVVLLEAGRVCAEGSVDEVLTEEVLAPVYGTDLVFGRLPTRAGPERPFVLPWLR